MNDFALQTSDNFGFNKEHFTIVVPDLPGFGRSEFIKGDLKLNPTLEYFELAADVCGKLMQRLKFKTYSVGGWNDGARVACLLAIKFQSRVDALILWGFIPVMDKESSYAIARTRDTGIWDPKILDFYSSVYGEENFTDLWHKYVDFVISTLELEDRFDIRDKLSAIKCPTLILHGDRDPIVSFSQHVKPLEMQIYDSNLMRFPNLAHNIHQATPNKFNKVFTSFVRSVQVA